MSSSPLPLNSSSPSHAARPSLLPSLRPSAEQYPTRPAPLLPWPLRQQNCTYFPSSPGSIQLHVVYFTGINDKVNWRRLIELQLSETFESCLYAAATSFDVVLSSSDVLGGAGPLLKSAARLAQRILPRASVHTVADNTFEYPGILQAHTIARAVPAAVGSRHLVLYFHGKGMFNPSGPRGADPARTADNEWLTESIVSPWALIVQRFAEDEGIQSVGVCGDDGMAGSPMSSGEGKMAARGSK
jgi:hypothetical protein